RQGNVGGAQSLSAGEARDVANVLDAALQEVLAVQQADMVASDKATNEQYAMTSMTMIIVASVAAVIAIVAALWIALGISAGLRKVMAVADAVAIGDLNQEVDVKTNDEIKDMVDTINVMTSNLRSTASMADLMANGDLTVEPKPLSEKDTLGKALESMVERLRGVVSDAIVAADNVAAG